MTIPDRALAHAPMILTLDNVGAADLAPSSRLRGADALIAETAAGIALTVANRTWSRLKACTADECRWAYYDHGPVHAVVGAP